MYSGCLPIALTSKLFIFLSFLIIIRFNGHWGVINTRPPPIPKRGRSVWFTRYFKIKCYVALPLKQMQNPPVLIIIIIKIFNAANGYGKGYLIIMVNTCEKKCEFH